MQLKKLRRVHRMIVTSTSVKIPRSQHMYEYTGRNVIAYYSGFLQKPRVCRKLYITLPICSYDFLNSEHDACFKVRNTTGNFPIYLLQNSLSLKISVSLNHFSRRETAPGFSGLSERKSQNVDMTRVFPDLPGRVINITLMDFP